MPPTNPRNCSKSYFSCATFQKTISIPSLHCQIKSWHVGTYCQVFSLLWTLCRINTVCVTHNRLFPNAIILHLGIIYCLRNNIKYKVRFFLHSVHNAQGNEMSYLYHTSSHHTALSVMTRHKRSSQCTQQNL